MPKLVYAGLSPEKIDFFGERNLNKEGIVKEIDDIINEIAQLSANKEKITYKYIGIINDMRYKDIIQNYTNSPHTGSAAHAIPVLVMQEFIDGMNHLIPDPNFKRGIYAYIRKQNPLPPPAPLPGFNILLQPIYYKEPASGHPINHNHDMELPDDEIFLLNIEDASVYRTRVNCEAQMARYPVPDDQDIPPVEKAFIPYDDVLKDFIDNLQSSSIPKYDSIRFEFGRNAPRGRITFVLSFFSGATKLRSKVTIQGTVYDGMLLDDHDLIPPPPDEA